MQLRVADVVQQTAHIKSFMLRHPDGDALPGYTAGAHINVNVTLPDGKPARRSYSLVAPHRWGAATTTKSEFFDRPTAEVDRCTCTMR